MAQLRLENFDFELDPALIAQEPLEQRDQSRLLVLTRPAGRLRDRIFRELPELLREGDLLVLNNTQVIPARFFLRRKSGAALEGLFLHERSAGLWEAMLRNAGKCKPGESLLVEGSAEVTVELRENLGEGRWRIAVSPQKPAVEILRAIGQTPLPPYIRRDHSGRPEDRDRYQTVYATLPGAVAAPTAGLHFTPELLEQLSKKGISRAAVTLHVGPGTFLPVKVDQIAEHKMHSEWFSLSADTAAAVNAARREGRRIVAVGTTSVRVLESVAARTAENRDLSAQATADAAAPVVSADEGWTDIFLYPPRPFRAVDALVTNFHLPKSTLLMLVAAFCSPGKMDGIEMILRAYKHAVEDRYRFFSYGDAMLIE